MQGQLTQQHTNDGDIHLLIFKIEEERFGIDITCLIEIKRTVEVAMAREERHFADGIINLTGDRMPVVDLRGLLGLKMNPDDQYTDIIAVEAAGKKFAFKVDAIVGVLKVAVEDFCPLAENTRKLQSVFFKSIAKLGDLLFALLDLEGIVSAEFGSGLNQRDVR